MQHTDQIVLADVYLDFQYLPYVCFPCWVVRVAGATLITVDPRSTKVEAALWCADHLTEDEMNAYRAGYGVPPVGQTAAGWTMEGLVSAVVPPALRLGRDRQSA